MSSPGDFAAFVERFGDESAEVLWLAGCSWLERAGARGRDTLDSRFRWYPQGELSHLRREIAGALALARFAVHVQAADNDLVAELMRPARAEAAAADKARRRAQTLPAELARLEKARQRRAGANGAEP